MKCILALGVLLGACKDKGTITIDLADASCGATRVRFQAIKGGACSCTCASCSCLTTAMQECILDVPCAGAGCSLDEVRANGGVEFDPQSAGQYALTYQFLDDSDAAKTLSVVCVVVDVDADGTASSSSMPAPACCP